MSSDNLNLDFVKFKYIPYVYMVQKAMQNHVVQLMQPLLLGSSAMKISPRADCIVF